MSVQEDTALPQEKQPRLYNVKQHSFRSAWLSEYSWLVYENEHMTCNVCTHAGKKKPFTSECTNFQNSTLMRYKISKDDVELYLMWQNSFIPAAVRGQPRSAHAY